MFNDHFQQETNDFLGPEFWDIRICENFSQHLYIYIDTYL